MPNADPMLERRRAYLELVQAARASGFQPLPTDDEALADRALLGSLTWTRRVFRVRVHTAGDRAAHSYHVADGLARADLLQHRLTVGPMSVQIYEGSSFFVVVLPAAGVETTTLADRAGQAANTLLNLSAPARFKPVDADREYPTVSTDPELAAGRLGEWKRRIDAVLLSSKGGRDAEMAFVIYKATFDDMMTLASDPATWFEDPLRAARRP